MSKLDPVQLELIKQSVALQQKFEELNASLTPSLVKVLQALTPLIAACIAGAISIFIAYKMFDKTKKLELEKRNEEKTKASQDNFKRIYSELSSIMFEFVNKSVLSDFEKIHFEYYKDQSYVYKYILIQHEKELQNCYSIYNSTHNTFEHHQPVRDCRKNIADFTYYVNEYKEKTEAAHEKMMNYTILMTDCFNRINKIIYEYEYLKTDSAVIELVRSFTDNLNGCTKPPLFADEMSASLAAKQVDALAFIKKRDLIIEINAVEHDEKLKPIIKLIQAKFKEETKI